MQRTGRSRRDGVSETEMAPDGPSMAERKATDASGHAQTVKPPPHRIDRSSVPSLLSSIDLDHRAILDHDLDLAESDSVDRRPNCLDFRRRVSRRRPPGLRVEGFPLAGQRRHHDVAVSRILPERRSSPFIKHQSDQAARKPGATSQGRSCSAPVPCDHARAPESIRLGGEAHSVSPARGVRGDDPSGSEHLRSNRGSGMAGLAPDDVREASPGDEE